MALRWSAGRDRERDLARERASQYAASAEEQPPVVGKAVGGKVGGIVGSMAGGMGGGIGSQAGDHAGSWMDQFAQGDSDAGTMNLITGGIVPIGSKGEMEGQDAKDKANLRKRAAMQVGTQGAPTSQAQTPSAEQVTQAQAQMLTQYVKDMRRKLDEAEGGYTGYSGVA